MIAESIAALFVSAFTMFDWGMEEVRFSCYLPTGNRTYDGSVPTEGMLACNKEHLGQTAMLYDTEYHFIGFFTCTDIGGNHLLREGKAVDIFRDTMDRAYEFIGTYGDHGYVIWIDADG